MHYWISYIEVNTIVVSSENSVADYTFYLHLIEPVHTKHMVVMNIYVYIYWIFRYDILCILSRSDG